MKTGRNVLVISLILGVILFNLSGCDDIEPNIQPLTESWEKIVPHQEIPEGLVSLSSEDCGSCHKDHYEEWKLSTHSHAWTDLQFQAEIKKESSPFMCINCHVPLQNQQEYIIEGLIDGDIYQPVKRLNPNFDYDLQQEGINCASCHVRHNAVIGPTGTSKAPHKTIKDTEHLSEKLCISCHNAVAVITPTLACSFETGDEWEAGPYYGEKTCIDCHMPEIERSIFPGFEKRPSRYHYFAGSGIPKFDTVQTKAMDHLGIYPAPFDSIYSLGDSLAFSLNIKNEFAGHKVPTGDPERFIDITFTLTDEKGEVIATKMDKIGEHWEWHPKVKKISDNNLLPNEERLFAFSHHLEKKGKLKLSVVVTKHRLDQKSADYNKLGSDYPLFITIFEKDYWVEVK